MPALALLATLALPLAPGPAPLGLPSGGRPGPGEDARALLTRCVHGDEPEARLAVFQGRMRTLPRARRLQMRFALRSSTPADPRWRAVPVPGWAGWRTSAPDVPAYVYDRQVRGLLAPASYRAMIRFRWLDEDGAVLAMATDASAPCRQPDARPDLVVRDHRVPAPRDKRGRYRALVANVGSGDAGPSSLSLIVAGTPAGATRVRGVAAGRAVWAALSGPACPAGATATATADAAGQVAEADEADNSLSVPCRTR